MPALLHSVLTILIVTMIGWSLMRFNVVTRQQWDGFERISYQVFFPAVILHSLLTADLSSVPALPVGGSLLAAVVITGGLLLALRPTLKRLLDIGDATFSSMMQGSIRWNTFMAVSMAGLLHGGRGLTLVAVAIVAIIPLMNLWTVMMLRRFGTGHSGSLNPLDLLKNPFIWSSLLGIALNLLGIGLPGPVMSAIDMCGKAALATALLLVGSGLRLGDLGRPTPALLLTTTLKLLLVPLLAGGLDLAAGLAGVDLSVLLICASMPCAGAAYIMARQMGGDAPLMAAVITFETVACIATIPVFQALFVRG